VQHLPDKRGHDQKKDDTVERREAGAKAHGSDENKAARGSFERSWERGRSVAHRRNPVLLLLAMSVQVSLPDELAEQIDHVASDRSAFVTEAVRRLLRESPTTTTADEVARINEFADELNREGEDVLEYQVFS
jgi:Arc/MetJ-type ribon-helix-helix transcriptional regulator